jgi:hypothetical protein
MDGVVTMTRLGRLAQSTRDLSLPQRGPGTARQATHGPSPPRPHGRLMLTVPGGLAEPEHDLTRARTSERRGRAKARGVKMGQKPKLTRASWERRRSGSNVGQAMNSRSGLDCCLLRSDFDVDRGASTP